MLFSVEQAAKAAGVSKQTIYRMLKNGSLSSSQDRNGNKKIDSSEMLRVFGTLREVPPEIPANNVGKQLEQQVLPNTVSVLQMENELLKLKIEHLQQNLNEAKEREQRAINQHEKALQTVERLTLRLEYTPATPAVQKPQRKAAKPKVVEVKKAVAKAAPKPVAKKAAVVVQKALPAKKKPVVKAVPKAVVKRAVVSAKAPAKAVPKKPAKTAGKKR